MGRKSAFPRKSQWATAFADASVRRDDGYAGVGIVLARFDQGRDWHQFTALVPRSNARRRHDIDPLYAEMYGCVLALETAHDLWWHDIQGVHLRCDNKNAITLLTAAERLFRKGAPCAAFDALTPRPDIRELLIWRTMLPGLCSPRWVPGHQRSNSKAARANRLADILSRQAG